MEHAFEWFEGTEEAREGDARGEPGIGHPHSPELDQLVALVARCFRFPRHEDGDSDRQYALPDSAVWLVTELKHHREELVGLLREEGTPPPMPAGVRLLKWELKNPPIAIIRMGIVSNVPKFVAATLLQLRARLEGKAFLAGNWSLRELVDRLEQVGVAVEIESFQSAGRSDERNS